MSEGQHIKTAKIASTVNIILLAITITVILLVTPLSVAVSRIDNKELPLLRDRQTALEISMKATEVRYYNIERMLDRVSHDIDYIRKRFEE